MITAERLRELMHYDPLTGVFIWKIRTSNAVCIGDVAGGLNSKGYVDITALGHLYRAHRLAWLYVHGVWPKGQIDHVDEDKTNNRIANLREATNGQNQQNKSKLRSDNTSGYLGVSYSKQTSRWQAQIQVDGKKKHLGFFDTPEQASEVHLTAKSVNHPFWSGAE